MKRGFIFVEGATELAFLELLLTEVANHNGLAMSVGRLRGNSPVEFRRSLYTSTKSNLSTHELYILDCGCDSTVVTAIRDRYKDLVDRGFTFILGLRDLYPLERNDLDKLYSGIARQLPSGPTPCYVCVAVMELEAWFLAEHTHFARVDPQLTLEVVTNRLGYDPSITDVGEMVRHPSRDLGFAYSTVGKSYLRGRHKSTQTMRAIDCFEIYFSVRPRLPALDRFLGMLDDFLS